MKRILKNCGRVGVLLMALSACQSADELKTEQYYSEGYQLYTTHCANCHQADGSGLADLYPPLQKSTYLSRRDEMICVVKNGLSGEIQVGGKTYNRPMPANPKLTDIEIAEIVTYVTNTWGVKTSYMPIDSVTAALTRCPEKKTP